MHNLTRRDFSVSIALSAFVGALAPSPTLAQETPKRGGTLVYGLGSDPPHFNIGITSDLGAQQVATNMFSQIIRTDTSGVPHGDLAESWDIAPDGRSYTFHIRKNVKWHDGKP